MIVVARSGPEVGKMKKAVSIWVRRAEGKTAECFAVTHSGPGAWEKADKTLREWARTAPKSGYDKCDFRVTYEDGEEYEGRYDLKHWTVELPSIERHMREFLGCYSGRRKPAHMKASDYERFLSYYRKDGTCEAYGKFMDEYDIGGESVERVEKTAHETYLDFLGA